jgi:hypothetical protein
MFGNRTIQSGAGADSCRAYQEQATFLNARQASPISKAATNRSRH